MPTAWQQLILNLYNLRESWGYRGLQGVRRVPFRFQNDAILTKITFNFLVLLNTNEEDLPFSYESPPPQTENPLTDSRVWVLPQCRTRPMKCTLIWLSAAKLIVASSHSVCDRGPQKGACISSGQPIFLDCHMYFDIFSVTRLARMAQLVYIYLTRWTEDSIELKPREIVPTGPSIAGAAPLSLVNSEGNVNFSWAMRQYESNLSSGMWFHRYH